MRTIIFVFATKSDTLHTLEWKGFMSLPRSCVILK